MHFRQYNTQNLIQFDEMPLERHRELSARGGRASGEVKRRKKAIKDMAQATLEYYSHIKDLGNEFDEFLKWKNRHNKARKKRERTPKKTEKERT